MFAESVRLSLSPGSGLLSRSGPALLFVPSGDLMGHDIFESAEPGRRIDALAEWLDTADEAPDLVAVEWHNGIRLLALGAVVVTSNAPSLPRLSTAEAGTWVERSIRPGPEPLVLGVGGDAADRATDLREGTVRSGGFQLSGSFVAPIVAEPVAAPPTAEPVAVEPIATEPVVAEPAITELSNSGWVAQVPAADSAVFLAAPDDTTIIPDREQVSDLFDRTDGSRADLDVDVRDRQPTADFELRFVNGRTEVVDRPLLLGRQPSADEPSQRAVTIDCPRVSRNHLLVRDAGGIIEIVDQGSSTRTHMIQAGTSEPIRLEPHTPYVAPPGSAIQLGQDQRFTVADLTDRSLFDDLGDGP